MKFTQTSVMKLRPPAGRADHWEPDDSTPGFGIRFRNGGDGVYGIRYSINGRDRRLSYSAVSRVSLDGARTWAKTQFAILANKNDPAIARATAAKTLATGWDVLIRNFLDHQARHGRAVTYIAENKRSLDKHFKSLHRFNVAGIPRAIIAQELARIRIENGPAAADRSRAHLSSFYRWVIAEGVAEHNPVQGTNQSGSKPRDRVLNVNELATIWRHLGDDDYGLILKLLILTGTRRNEIGSLRRSEINIKNEQIELPGRRTKSGLDHIVPLSPPALSILKSKTLREDSDFVFGWGGGYRGYSSGKERLDAKLSIPSWTVHDFRRAVSTAMHEQLKILPHIVEEILGHKSGHKSGVAGIYNKALYLDEKRAALNAWADHIAKIVGGGR